jgi:hypothetical protein
MHHDRGLKMHAANTDEAQPNETTPILSGNETIVTGLTFCLNRYGEIQSRTRGFWEWLCWSLVFFVMPNALSNRYVTFWNKIQPAEEQPAEEQPAEEQPARILDFTEVASTYTSNQIKTLLQSMPENSQQLKLKVPHYDGQAYNCLENDTLDIQKALFSAIQANPSLRKQLVIPFRTANDGPLYGYINRDMWFLSRRKKEICRQMVESAGYTWHDRRQEGMQPCENNEGLNVFQNGKKIYIAPAANQERREDDMETHFQTLVAIGAITVIGGMLAWRFGGGENHTKPNFSTKPQEDQDENEDESKDGTPMPLRADQLTLQAAGEDALVSRAGQPTQQDPPPSTGLFPWLSAWSPFRSAPATIQNITREALEKAREEAINAWHKPAMQLMLNPFHISKKEITELLSKVINASCQEEMHTYCRDDYPWFFRENISIEAKKQLLKFAIYFYSNEYDRKNGKELREQQNIQNWTFFYHVMAQVKPNPSITPEQMLSMAFHTYLPIGDLSAKRNRPYKLQAHPDKAQLYEYIFQALEEVKKQYGYETEVSDLKTAVLNAATEGTEATKDYCAGNAFCKLAVLDTPSDTDLDGGFRIFLSTPHTLGDTCYADWVNYVGGDEDSRMLWDKAIKNVIEQATSIHTPSPETESESYEGGGGGAGMAPGLKRIGF